MFVLVHTDEYAISAFWAAGPITKCQVPFYTMFYIVLLQLLMSYLWYVESLDSDEYAIPDVGPENLWPWPTLR